MILRGPRAWRWGWRYLRDPVGCLALAQRQLGNLSALRVPVLPGRPVRQCVLAIGAHYNRVVLGDPETFRPGGQGIGGPAGSAQCRLRFGLTRMTGEKHRLQRQLLLPAFQKKVVEQMVPRMAAIVDQVLADWRPGPAPIDIFRQMHHLTMLVASQTLFGYEDPQRSYALGAMINEWARRNYSPGTTYFRVNCPGSPYRRMLQYAGKLAAAIEAHIHHLRQRGIEGRDVMSLLIRAHDRGEADVTKDDLIAQGTILFAASYETSASTLTWTLFLLAQHPQVWAQVLDELRGQWNPAAPDADGLARLPLLEAVVNESMRVLPPVPLTLRAVTTPTQLDGLSLGKGDRVICSHYLTHREPGLYPQPNRFDPDRWKSIKPGHYEYIPFSAGPRLCIGYSFAMNLIKLVLAKITTRFRLSLPPGTRVDRRVEVTMKPRDGMPMVVSAQDGRFESTPVRGNVHDMVELPRR